MKPKTKIFSVSKRFTIWVETKIPADDLNDAATKSESMNLHDFVKFPSGVLNDYDTLPGTTVGEEW